MNANEQEKQVPRQVQMAAVAQELMTRAKLKGKEVDAYANAYNWLQEIAAQEVLVIGVAHLNKMREKQEALETETADLRGEIAELHSELDDAYKRLTIAVETPVTDEELPVLPVEELEPVESDDTE